MYHTHLSAKQVYKRIKAITTPAQLLADVEEGIVYEGRVTPKLFSLQKATSKSENWAPNIDGEIRQEDDYTYVGISVSLSKFIYILNTIFYISPYGRDKKDAIPLLVSLPLLLSNGTK